MKLYSLIIIFISIIYINSLCDDIEPKRSEDCNGNLSKKDKIHGNYCCYLKTSDGKECIILTQDDYDDIKGLIKRHRDTDTIYSLDCHSFYLKIGFLNILFLLFLNEY